MSFIYNPPTGLTGTASGLNASLSWSVPSLIASPSLLLHFNGTNGSTVITDSSANNLPMTAHGSAAITTTNPKFGTGSLNGGGSSGDNVTTPIAAGGPLDLSTGDFTIELWVYPNSAPGYSQPIIFAGYGGTGWNINLSTAVTAMSLGFNFGSAFISDTGSASPVAAGVWSHIAAVRLGNIFGLWLNGAPIQGPFTLAGSIGTDSQLQLRTGTPAYGAGFDGGEDEVRIVKGTAFYTPGVSFTPPNSPYGTPFGYDIYRNGVSVATFAGGPAFTDVVPVGGIYTYKVAAWDGSSDTSDLSAPFVLNVNAPVVPEYGKFVASAVYPPTLLINAAGIKPRVWMPKENITVKS